MKLSIYLLLAMTIVSAAFLGNCTKPQTPDLIKASDVSSSNVVKKTAPARLPVTTKEEVTFYPTYGHKKDRTWNIHLRGWVHENREHLSRFVTKIADIKNKCSGSEMNNFQSRSDDFEDDDKSFEMVIVKFDADPEDKSYTLKRSGPTGIVEMDLTLTEEKGRQLLEKQASPNGWLTFRAVSKDHTGLGRVKLIEPEGISVVSDIDDTIKVTEIPAGEDIVLRNTFCLDFKAAPDMAKMYTDLGDVAFHYVSGGPQQMFGPLYDFLIVGPGGFPEGTFHLKFFPKNILDRQTREDLKRIAVRSLNLKRFAVNSLDDTFDHKVKEITSLMDRYPNRQFILVGDSGEIDPEVYSEIRRKRGGQVKEIWIRDVLNDAQPNPNHYRLDGMKTIKVNPPVCIEDSHFDRLFVRVNKEYPDKKYQRNACNQ